MKTIIDVLEDRVSRNPQATDYNSLRDNQQLDSITYQQIVKRVHAIAYALQDRGAKKNERILIIVPPSFELIASIYACFAADTIAVPAYPPLNAETASRILTILKDADIKYVLTTNELANKMNFSKYVAPFVKITGKLGFKKIKAKEKIITATAKTSKLNVICVDEVPDDMSELFKPTLIKSDDIAYLQYTSGSTSHPKGVILTHKNLMANLAQIEVMFRFNKNDIMANWLPPYHDMGLLAGIFCPLFFNFKVISITPLQFLKKVQLLLEIITEHQATVTGGPDFFYKLFTTKISEENREKYNLSSLRLIYSGAEKVQASTWENFYRHFSCCGLKDNIFLPCYGLAESTLFVTGKYGSLDEISFHFNEHDLKHRKVSKSGQAHEMIKLVSVGKTSVGNAVPETQLLIVDPETGNQVLENEVGEICIKGDAVTSGYWNNKKANDNAFVTLPINGKDQQYLRTGDLGFLHNGELFITGRLKELIIIAGKNHYPNDIEIHVESAHEALKHARVAAFSNEVNQQEALIILIEVKSNLLKAPKEYYQEIVNAVRSAISKHHQLQVHEVVLAKSPAVPKTTSGKTKRLQCKEYYQQSMISVLFKG